MLLICEIIRHHNSKEEISEVKAAGCQARMEARYSQLTKADSLTPFNEFASPTDTLLEKDESPIQEQNNEKVCGDETQITVLLFSLLTGLFVIIVVLLHINNSLRSQLKITLLHC